MAVRGIQSLILGGVVVASLFASVNADGQGPYYPVNPPGAPYGNTYTGIVVHSNASLQALQDSLTTLYSWSVTLEAPIPIGKVPPTTFQFSYAVAAAVQDVLTGSAPPEVTLASVSAEAVAWRPTDGGPTAAAIAQAIISYNPATAIPNLNTVVDVLAKTQPTLIDTILPSILAQAGTDATVAQGIPQLVRTAIANIPQDRSRIASIVYHGLDSINCSVLTATQKRNAFIDPSTGLVSAVLGAPFANNNPPLIDVLTQGVTKRRFLGMVPPAGPLSSLDQILNAAVAAMPTVNNSTMGALAAGALRSNGGSSAAIGVRLATASPSTQPYTNAVVFGYSNSANLATYQSAVTANPTLADAVAIGAMVKGSVGAALIVKGALLNGTGTSPRNIVAAAVGANQASVVAIVTGAIDPGTHIPYGSATFRDIAFGAASTAPLESIGASVNAILANSSASTSTLSTVTVMDVLDGAIQGAAAGNKAGAYADIVYQAELVALNTTGVSTFLVRQAVDSLSAVGGPGISYLGVIAALAGDSGANSAAIQSNGFNELTLTGGDLTAATHGANLITALRSDGSQTFVNTMAAFNTAVGSASPTQSVLADLYAAILANPGEADAALACALKQSFLSDALLLSVADDALRVSTPNSTLSPSLSMVRDVVTRFKGEALAGSIEDVFSFVGHQIVMNPALTNDIAMAATGLDPNHAHFVAHAAAFQNPTAISSSVNALFSYAQITNPAPLAVPSAGNPTGARSAILDQPGAAAAITAGLTSGILEANMSAANTQAALISTITAAVTASIAQNGTNLQGMDNPFTAPGDTGSTFRQSVGFTPTAFTSHPTAGAAGAITGYVAQVTNPGDSSIGATTKAVLAVAVGGAASPYALENAQAAGQALRWVGGPSVSAAANPFAQIAGNPAYDIAFAMAPSVAAYATLQQLMNAVSFGITEAANGTIGAGAVGLNAGTLTIKANGNNNADFYLHRSAAGPAVLDLFTLNTAFYTPSPDIGLRIRDGAVTLKIACEPAGTLTSPLRIHKNGTTYGILLVDPASPDASPIRIQTSSGIKALKKLP